MDFLQFFDMILHVDKYLGTFIEQYGTLVYAVLFAIIFCETGLVVLPFLPGDSLLFIAGAYCATGAMNEWVLMGLLLVAAISGNTVNYWVGRAIGQRVFTHDYRWLDKDALRKTHAFYENHGGKLFILPGFLPVVRTSAPFAAGWSAMTVGKFHFFNVIGAVAWIVGLVAAGYFFGNIPVIREHLNTIVIVGVGAAVIPVALGAVWKLSKRAWR